jgi:hypothetical protein
MIPLTDANLARIDLLSFFLGCFTMGAALFIMVGIASLIGRIIYKMRGEE